MTREHSANVTKLVGECKTSLTLSERAGHVSGAIPILPSRQFIDDAHLVNNRVCLSLKLWPLDIHKSHSC